MRRARAQGQHPSITAVRPPTGFDVALSANFSHFPDRMTQQWAFDDHFTLMAVLVTY
jgi:hypothetical protein